MSTLDLSKPIAFAASSFSYPSRHYGKDVEVVRQNAGGPYPLICKWVDGYGKDQFCLRSPDGKGPSETDRDIVNKVERTTRYGNVYSRGLVNGPILCLHPSEWLANNMRVKREDPAHIAVDFEDDTPVSVRVLYAGQSQIAKDDLSLQTAFPGDVNRLTVYSTDEPGEYPIVGAYSSSDERIYARWSVEGRPENVRHHWLTAPRRRVSFLTGAISPRTNEATLRSVGDPGGLELKFCNGKLESARVL